MTLIMEGPVVGVHSLLCCSWDTCVMLGLNRATTIVLAKVTECIIQLIPI